MSRANIRNIMYPYVLITINKYSVRCHGNDTSPDDVEFLYVTVIRTGPSPQELLYVSLFNEVL